MPTHARRTTRTTRPDADATALAPDRPADLSAVDDAPLASTGVPSPYALAELVLGRTVDWDRVAAPEALLEEAFQTPYQNLFDPKHGSPLYLGQELQDDGTIVRKRPELAHGDEGGEKTTDDKRADADALAGVRTLAELVQALGPDAADRIPVRSAVPTPGGTFVELGQGPTLRRRLLGQIFDIHDIDMLFPPVRLGYHPDGLQWQDVGRFFDEAAEFFDPVQGAVGDCYVIAAMSSVAWSMPYTITDRSRAKAVDNQRFVHQIGFTGGNGLENVEVSDSVLVYSGTTSAPYARSKEPGEIWPAVYEKAYAKWRLGEPTDFPAIPSIAGGDPSIACRALTGLSDYRQWHTSFTAAQVLSTIQAHSVDGRTTTPMVAWTHGTEPTPGAYSDATIVANHAYSILGWMRRVPPVLVRDFLVRERLVGPVVRPEEVAAREQGGELVLGASPRARAAIVGALWPDLVGIPLRPRTYVILRNPWGSTPGTGASTASGTHQARDVDWWRSVPLGTDGVFALEINAYHRLFAGTGGAA